MGIKIRDGRAKDFEEVLLLNRNMYSEAHSDRNFGDYVFFKAPSRSRMRKWFDGLLKEVKKRDAIYLVAEIGGHLVGQCFIRRDTPGSELSHVGVLSILVGKEYRNIGIGGKLLDSALKESVGKFEILHLRVFASNKTAKRLYVSRGFRSFGIAPGFIKRGNKYIDREYMYLKL